MKTTAKVLIGLATFAVCGGGAFGLTKLLEEDERTSLYDDFDDEDEDEDEDEDDIDTYDMEEEVEMAANTGNATSAPAGNTSIQPAGNVQKQPAANAATADNAGKNNTKPAGSNNQGNIGNSLSGGGSNASSSQPAKEPPAKAVANMSPRELEGLLNNTSQNNPLLSGANPLVSSNLRINVKNRQSDDTAPISNVGDVLNQQDFGQWSKVKVTGVTRDDDGVITGVTITPEY